MVELDPDKREWEYDGDGAKIYKYDPRFPVKRRYEKTDLDGGVPWIKESDQATLKMNGDYNE